MALLNITSKNYVSLVKLSTPFELSCSSN